MQSLWIVAQAGGSEPTGTAAVPIEQGQTSTTQKVPADPNSQKQQQTTRGMDPMGLVLLGLLLVFMYFILFRGPKKREQEHRKMIQSLKKNDKVRTIGGIIGTIVDVSDEEITLKVDESTNTKIKVIPSAIGKNLSGEQSK